MTLGELYSLLQRLQDAMDQREAHDQVMPQEDDENCELSLHYWLQEAADLDHDVYMLRTLELDEEGEAC